MDRQSQKYCEDEYDKEYCLYRPGWDISGYEELFYSPQPNQHSTGFNSSRYPSFLLRARPAQRLRCGETGCRTLIPSLWKMEEPSSSPLITFRFHFTFSKHRGLYEVLELGDSYENLVAALRLASLRSQCRVRGFYEMTAEEVSTRCQLPLDQAILAKQREFDEPFEILERERKEGSTQGHRVFRKALDAWWPILSYHRGERQSQSSLSALQTLSNSLSTRCHHRTGG